MYSRCSHLGPLAGVPPYVCFITFPIVCARIPFYRVWSGCWSSNIPFRTTTDRSIISLPSSLRHPLIIHPESLSTSSGTTSEIVPLSFYSRPRDNRRLISSP